MPADRNFHPPCRHFPAGTRCLAFLDPKRRRHNRTPARSQAHLAAVKEQYVLTKPCLLREMLKDELLAEVSMRGATARRDVAQREQRALLARSHAPAGWRRQDLPHPLSGLRHAMDENPAARARNAARHRRARSLRDRGRDRA